ncbi:MAG: SDR family NAD(P)-dependent oxidoreductase, partial [Thermodesulfobacteriota bacterium]
MKRFKGKIALVTGATSGIGRATTLAFAREGAKVVVAGRRHKEGEETVRRIREAGSEAIFVKTDVTIESEVEALIQKIIAAYGRIDCAFNNAGTINLSSIVEQTEANYKSIM